MMGDPRRSPSFFLITAVGVLLLIVLPVNLRAPEQESRETGWWGGLALGGTGEHLSMLVMAGMRKDHRLLSMRWNGHTDGAFILAGLADTDHVSELGVLYGLQTEYRRLDFAISGGPSWVSKTTYPGTFSDTRKRTRSSVGMTLGAEATLALGGSLAMGVQGYGGLSSLETLWGVGWVLKFGRLRWE